MSLSQEYAIDLRIVAPHDARAILDCNIHNRNLNTRRVSEIAGAIMRGEWKVSPDCIHLARDGRLLNGQHRLHAIQKAGIAVPCLVLVGGDVENQEITDSGRKRSFSDVLVLRGEKNAKRVASIVSAIWSFEESGIPEAESRSVTPTPQQLLEVFNRHLGIRETVKALNETLPGIPPATHGALLYLFSKVHRDDATFFFDRYKDGVGLEAGSPILTLRNRLVAESARGGSNDLKRTVRVAFIVRAWNAYRDGERLLRLQWKPGGAHPEKFPKINGYTYTFPDPPRVNGEVA